MKKIYKKISCLLIVICTFSLVSCTFSIGSISSNTSNQMKSSHFYLVTSNTKSYNLKNGDTINLDVKIETKRGSLEVLVLDNDNNEIFKVENPEEEISEKIKITEDGTYKIKVKARHGGSYNISWSIEDSNGEVKF